MSASANGTTSTNTFFGVKDPNAHRRWNGRLQRTETIAGPTEEKPECVELLRYNQNKRLFIAEFSIFSSFDVEHTDILSEEHI